MKIIMWIWIYGSLALITGCVGIGGEQIDLSHEALTTPAQQFSEKLKVENPATDLREEKDRIGRATFTVFAITTGSVRTTNPVDEQMVDQIIEALTSLGYQANKSTNVSANASNAEDPLTLKIAINEIWFRNYNWTFPLVPTWGDIDITISLVNSSGNKLFEKSYQGGGSSLCLTGHCGFSNATKEAMTEILNVIISDFSSEPVRSLIASAK
ncbi:MAG: hypothetical protein KGZ88_05450 [Methylomicrobium sp.]|nr:hypothetical protein [Methylomicrobium sp.]